MSDFAKEILPLSHPAACSRDIKLESSMLDDEHVQVRGQLTDTRVDFEDAAIEHVVHCIVINLTINLSARVITAAEFGLPKMAIADMCEKLPRSADALVGMSLGRGLSSRLKELYGGVCSCFHLSSLLQAMVPYLPQVYAWSKSFRFLDEDLPPEAVPMAMDKIGQTSLNSCHAWATDNGGIIVDFNNNNYAPMLQRIAPRLRQRWEKQEREKEVVAETITVKEVPAI